jgi:hypothetical protein
MSPNPVYDGLVDLRAAPREVWEGCWAMFGGHMQADMRTFIRLENIKHYRNLLDVSHNVTERATILELLAEERQKLKEDCEPAEND